MELADKINEISDIDLFVQNFVDETNSLSNISSLDFHPANRRSKCDLKICKIISSLTLETTK